MKPFSGSTHPSCQGEFDAIRPKTISKFVWESDRMTIGNRNLPTLLLALTLGSAVAASAQDPKQPDPAQPPPKQPDPKQIVQQVVNTELTTVKADQSRWLYYEVDRKPNSVVSQWVAQTPKGELRRIVKENSHKLSDAEQHQKMDAFLQDSSAQARDRKKLQEDDRQTVDLLTLLPQAFLWTCGGTQDTQMTLHFKPNPTFHAPNREARVLSGVEGDLVVNSSQHRIISLKGQLIHDVKFGGGLLGELKAGGTFDIERREMSQGEWQITETHVHLQGHMLLFKSVSEQQDDEKSNFKLLPSSFSSDQAESELLQKGDLATN